MGFPTRSINTSLVREITKELYCLKGKVKHNQYFKPIKEKFNKQGFSTREIFDAYQYACSCINWHTKL